MRAIVNYLGPSAPYLGTRTLWAKLLLACHLACHPVSPHTFLEIHMFLLQPGPFAGVLVVGGLLFGICMKAPDSWQLPIGGTTTIVSGYSPPKTWKHSDRDPRLYWRSNVRAPGWMLIVYTKPQTVCCGNTLPA